MCILRTIMVTNISAGGKIILERLQKNLDFKMFKLVIIYTPQIRLNGIEPMII